MKILWYKLERLILAIKKFSRDTSTLQQRLLHARNDLHGAQKELLHDKMDNMLFKKSNSTLRMLYDTRPGGEYAQETCKN